MKSFVWSVVGFAVLGTFMVAWSIAGRLLTAKDDFAVIMGFLVLGAMFGLVGAGVIFGVKRLAKEANNTGVVGKTEEKV